MRSGSLTRSEVFIFAIYSPLLLETIVRVAKKGLIPVDPVRVVNGELFKQQENTTNNTICA